MTAATKVRPVPGLDRLGITVAATRPVESVPRVLNVTEAGC
jgi:hypothetical protein